jgi:hypothetical protein
MYQLVRTEPLGGRLYDRRGKYTPEGARMQIVQNHLAVALDGDDHHPGTALAILSELRKANPDEADQLVVALNTGLQGAGVGLRIALVPFGCNEDN